MGQEGPLSSGWGGWGRLGTKVRPGWPVCTLNTSGHLVSFSVGSGWAVKDWLKFVLFHIPDSLAWASPLLHGTCNPAALSLPIPPSLQERLAQCQDQSSRHAAELRDFKNKMLPLLEAAEKEREALRTEADTISGRVDRLEREVDYLETQNPALPCVELEEKGTGGPEAKGKGRRNEKYDMVTGKKKRKKRC